MNTREVVVRRTTIPLRNPSTGRRLDAARDVPNTHKNREQ